MTAETSDNTNLHASALALGVFTLHAESDCQTVDTAAVSSLTLMLSSRVPYLDANTNIVDEPVVGSNVCETVTFVVTFPQPVFCTAMSDKRPRRADETDICDAHPEFAGSLICTEESEIHFDRSQDVDDIRSFADASLPPKFRTELKI